MIRTVGVMEGRLQHRLQLAVRIIRISRERIYQPSRKHFRLNLVAIRERLSSQWISVETGWRCSDLLLGKCSELP